MTPNQQTDLKTWLKDQSQELPASLDNVFIEDCLEELKNNEEARDRFDLQGKFTGCFYLASELIEDEVETKKEAVDFIKHFLSFFELGQTLILFLTLLSRTPEGAVMPFLDVEIDYFDHTWLMSNVEHIEIGESIQLRVPQTLDHLLYREFTEALRVGKTLDEALKIINKIYLLNRYT